MSKDVESFELLSSRINREIHLQRSYKLGRVLTVVDASFSDPEQRKAVKDLVNDIFYSGSYWNAIQEFLDEYAMGAGIEVTKVSCEPLAEIK